MNTPDCDQGGEIWLKMRAGRATASNFHKILAKGQGKTRAGYLLQVAAERLTGQPTDTYKNGHMERGNEQEPQARELYERINKVMVETVGLILHDDLLVSGSPDGLIGDDGGMEIKSVIPTVQLETIKAGGYPSEHKAQIQGNLWISGRTWWDFVSYCEPMPAHLQIYTFRVIRDEVYISNMEAETRSFLDDVQSFLNSLPQPF